MFIFRLFILLLTSASLFSCAKNNYKQNEISSVYSQPPVASLEKKTEAPSDTTREVTKKKNIPKEVKWLTFEEAMNASNKKRRKIFIEIYTDWCGYCKKMDKTTLKDPNITTYLSKKYYAVKLNAESQAMVTYKGKTITESQLATKIFKATVFPTTVYLDQDLNLLQPLAGFLEVDMLDQILHFYGEDHYKTTTWENFQTFYGTSY